MRPLPKCIIAVAAIAACSSEPPAGPPSSESIELGGAMADLVGSCNNVGNTSSSWTKPNGQNAFACGTLIRINNNAGLASGIISSAAAIWNGTLNNHGLPTFTTSGGSPGVTIVASGTGAYACGYTAIPNRTITIYRAASEAACGGGGFRAVLYSSATEMGKLLGHELGHALGISQHYSFGVGWANDTHTKYCMMAMPPTGPINGSTCEHERQLIYYSYGLHEFFPYKTQDFINMMDVSSNGLIMLLGGQGSATVDELFWSGQTGGGPLSPGSATFSWSLTGSGAGQFSLSPSGAQATVTSIGAPASATLTVAPTDVPGYNIRWPLQNAMNVLASIPAPSGLGVSNVTSSGASLSWTAGDASGSTVVQYAVAGSGGFVTFNTYAAGTTSATLTGLTECTSYDVRLYHVRNGYNGDLYTVSQAFATPSGGGLCPPTNFTLTQCYLSGGARYYTMIFTAGGGKTQIGQSSTSDPAGITVINSNASSPVTVGPYSTSYHQTLYFWARSYLFGSGSAWVLVNADLPLDPYYYC